MQDQTRTQNQAQLADGTCVGDCTGDRARTQDQIRTQDQTQLADGTGDGAMHRMSEMGNAAEG
ncbi:MAG: hypothetical protein E4H05_10475 [Acidimicrobiales bacterium]|nr:MAG: hypothetical protein E4H05_10475 [Acidimicrobiales bacterium]